MFTAVCIKFRNFITAQFILLLSNNSEKPFAVKRQVLFLETYICFLYVYHFFFTVSGVTINVESWDLCRWLRITNTHVDYRK